MPTPTQPSVLTIEGNIGLTNEQSKALFDMNMLEQLPVHTLQTSTVVTDGVKQFQGFLMKDLLDRVKSQGTLVEASAHNGYAINIPIADFYTYPVMIATHMDGKKLHLSGKGPLWIVYPRDDHKELQDIRYDYRWVWQLSALVVK